VGGVGEMVEVQKGGRVFSGVGANQILTLSI
jgi:hypothetical protein